MAEAAIPARKIKITYFKNEINCCCTDLASFVNFDLKALERREREREKEKKRTKKKFMPHQGIYEIGVKTKRKYFHNKLDAFRFHIRTHTHIHTYHQ